MTGVVFRPAVKQDCHDIAALYSISSDGVADYIWSTLAESGDNVLDIGAQRYAREDVGFSYRNVTIAEHSEKVIGMLVAFPMNADDDNDEEIDPVLLPYRRLEAKQSYYICGIALLPDYRSQGIGSKFMGLAERQARDQGFDSLSLVVFEQNVAAVNWYKRIGFHEVRRERVVPHKMIHYSGDALLMVKMLG